MRSTLKAGQPIETLTQTELGEELGKFAAMLQDINEPGDVYEGNIQIQADSNGVIPLTTIYRVPPGYDFSLHRTHINAPGATPATPLNTAGAYLFFYRNDDSLGNMFMFIPGSSAWIAPVVIVEGSYTAKMMRTGSLFVMQGAGFVANQSLSISYQGKLEVHRA